MAETSFTLKFVDEEQGGLTIKLTSLPEDLTSLCVVLFQPNEQIYRVWMIAKPHLTAGEWRTTINSGVIKEGEDLMIYCLKRYEVCPHDDLHEVITQVQTTIDGFHQSVVINLDCKGRSSQPHDIAYLTGQGNRSELNLKTRPTSPNTYRVLLFDEPQLKKPILMIFGLKNIAYVTTKYLMMTTPSSPEIAIPLTFPTRSIYKCAVVELTEDGESFQCGRISDVVFKSVMAKEELGRLKQKAEDFIQSMATHEVKFLHRTKPRAAMDEIMNERNGLMETHLKDNNGDPHSPINNNLNGIFFSLGTVNSQPYSPFGDYRLHLPVTVLFNQEANLYFADFYCVGGPHTVTLVLAKPGSESDNFCHNFLLKLDKMNNLFLFLEDGKVQARESKGCLYLELFYTENVDIRHLQGGYNTPGREEVYFSDVQAFGVGDSVESGYPKTPGCPICKV